MFQYLFVCQSSSHSMGCLYLFLFGCQWNALLSAHFCLQKVKFLCSCNSRIEGSDVLYGVCLRIKRERILRYNFDINIVSFIPSDIFYLNSQIQVFSYFCGIRICFDYCNFQVGPPIDAEAGAAKRKETKSKNNTRGISEFLIFVIIISHPD